MNSVEEVIERLKALARPGELAGMARFGMSLRNRLGVRIPDVRALARPLNLFESV